MHHLPNVSGPFYSSFSFILLPFFFLFVFFVSLLLFGILSQHFLYRLGTFFSFFPFAPFSPYIIFWFSFSDCSFLLSFYALFSVSLRRFVASKIVVKSKWDRSDGFTKKKKKKKEKIPSARNARRCSPSPLVFLFRPSFHLRRVSLLFAFLPRGPCPSSLASSLASYLHLSLIRIALRVSLSGIRGRNNGDTCPRSEASHMNGSFIRCNGVL